MEIAGCNCSGNRLGNTGYPNVKPFGVTAGIYMVPINAADGTRNGLDLTSTNLGAAILAMVNNVDPSKRAYPYLGLKNVAPTEGEAVYQTADDGQRFKLRNGIQNITFEVWGVTEQFYGKTASACIEFGIYQVDNCGNLKGQKEGEYLYPRPVNKESFNSMYVPTSNEAGAKVVFDMDFDFLTSDSNQWMLPAEDFGVLSLLSLKGIIDVRLTLVDVQSATVSVVDAEFDYGYANNPLPWKGAVAADFTFYNVTDGAAITKTVAESATVPGRYTITAGSAIGASDIVTLNAFKAAAGNLMNGYEGIELEFVYSWT